MPANDPTRPALQERAEPKMSSKTYKQIIEELGLSQVRAARFFGISDRQGQRLARGEYPVPPAIAHLAKLMLEYDVKPVDLDDRFEPYEYMSNTERHVLAAVKRADVRVRKVSDGYVWSLFDSDTGKAVARSERIYKTHDNALTAGVRAKEGA